MNDAMREEGYRRQHGGTLTARQRRRLAHKRQRDAKRDREQLALTATDYLIQWMQRRF